MLIETLSSHFDDLDHRQRTLIRRVPVAELFWSPLAVADTMLTMSVGGGVLRSAAMVEQVFLGMTRRLWDDPFEWTLPEKLSKREMIIEYLDEVAATRRNGFEFLSSDADLSRQLPAPEKLKTVMQVILEAIARAENYLGRAETVARMVDRN